VQTALARRARLVAIGLLLIPVTAVVLTQLTRVDEALVTASREGAAPDTRPLTGYAVAVGACALVLGLLATLRAPGALQRRDVRRAVVALGAAVAVAAVVVSVVAIASRADNLLERLRAEPNSVAQVSGGQTRLSSLSTTGRVDQWRLAGEMIGEEPLRGHGTGTFAARWAIERDDLNLYVLQPHSLELEVLVELGIVGGAALLLMLAGVGWLLVLGLRADRGVGAAATACVVAFVGFASVDWVFSFPLLLAVALLVVGSAGGPGQGRPVNLVLTVAVALAGLTVLAGPALGHWYLERSRAAETRSLAESGRLADRARTFNRWDPAIVSQQARVAEGVGSYETAARLYGRAAELAQQPWTDLYRQARALRSAGRGEASLAACRAAIRSNPLEPELRRGVCEEAD
jgi:O-antigen ligase